MRVLLVSKAMVVGAYQRKAEEIAALGVELVVLTPPSWRDRRGAQALQPVYTSGYQLRSIPIRFNGAFHVHFYPTLPSEIRRIAPDLLHMDEEPYNFATWLALRAAQRQRIPALFFTWQNLLRRYPPPFSWFERNNYTAAVAAIAGSQEAADVLRRKGYAGKLAVIPQFGVDPAHFVPAQERNVPAKRLHIGYAGGLLPEKGLDDLLHACARVRGEWRLTLAGEGSERMKLEKLAASLGIASRVLFAGRIASTEMPAFYRSLDVLVLPSRTLPNWKEQFGRVLIEAMACEVPVVGSSSGEIPQVIGDAGLIFPEGDHEALAERLQGLLENPEVRLRLAQAGRRRVLARFTMQQVAQRTVAFYRAVLERL
ncbi:MULTISPECIES: glycosyltransferase [Caldilinea]|jgi:glycosyltransferase involved in cell wall biosynthesis|uniref:Putative glycosyltransferase n=1 Tax=Caldilinea aerophila (strain DSM 14535 / JCM 11387 / NBRC 104270 / STL-6-O1) TaxID=926550 RepID=I0HZQ8_CALAS|nr:MULTISPECIES: glycosyltransferase [Caldilinea]MBO9392411.1 glycosyltransferase family 4 protein [Caldilinea sp.]BAL98495.1 putative glycosyltransferase [Caldilinea aerophila DSM 14535 = NBRC 104270]GIV74924.1 MAG: glycosyl transferase family 1 [Caldilinea sp.]